MTLEIKGSGVPTNEAQVAQLETILGRQLPADYRVFLLKHNGGTPSHRLFEIPGCGEALVRVFTGIGTRVDIQKWLREAAGDLPAGWIIIGFDPGGNVLLSDHSGAVHYWDRALHFPASSPERNTFEVAKSFSEFLGTLRDLPAGNHS